MSFALLAALLGACAPAPPEAPRGLVVALESDPQSLDPRFGIDAASSRLGDLLHVGLTRADARAARVGDLATSWEWLDARTVRFRLRADVRFDDGRPLTAADVAATYRAVLDPRVGSPRRGGLEGLREITVPDPTTVVMRLDAPAPAFLDATGLGIVPDAVGRVLELARGSVGFLQETPEPEVLTWLAARPDLRVQRTPGTSFAYLLFNCRDPRFAQRRVRRAIAHAIDRGALAERLLGGTVRLASGLLAPEHWAHAAAPVPRHDAARARRLLDRAGWRDPDGPGPAPRFRVVFKVSNQPARRRLAEALQEQLATVGIALDVRPFEWGTLFADVRAGRFELTSLAWVGVGDPDLYYQIHHSRMVPPAGYNRGGFADGPMDRLTTRARDTTDADRRRVLYARVQRRAAHALPVVPLWWEDRVVAHRADLHAFVPEPSGALHGLAMAGRAP
jgi:peptide/nickel transport system substrate-binding protein